MAPSEEEFRKAGYAAVDRIIEYNRSLAALAPADKEQSHVVSQVEPGYLSSLIPREIPEHGEPLSTIQDDLEKHIMPGITHWQSPNFMAYFPANSSYPGILADMYSDMLTCAAFNWQASPAVTELETIVMDQLARAIGLSTDFQSQSQGGGVIFGSASEATLTMMIAARDKYVTSVDKLVVIYSDQTHSGAEKAAKLLGLKTHKIKTRREDEYGITGESMSLALQELREQGLQPFFVILTLGSTSLCAVDDFSSLKPVLKGQNLWVHLDAAYAGAALILPSQQHYINDHLDLFDSIDMNAHKWLLTNFDCSCLWLRDRQPLIAAMTTDPAYLQNKHSESGLVTDYRNWGISLGRRFRALKLWFVFRSYGLEGLRDHIQRHLDYSEKFTSLVRENKDMTIVGTPRFALCVFKYKNDLTKAVYERINAEGRLFLTSTIVDGETVIRVVGCAPSVTEAHLVGAYNVLVDTYAQLNVSHPSS